MGNVSLEEFRASMNLLAQALMTQVNREMGALANPIGGMSAYRIREFLSMNPPEFSTYKVEENPNGFINEVYKTLAIMVLTSREKAKLATYQLKDLAQIWHEQWKHSKMVEAGPIEWETFKSALLYRFFLRELGG